ncbi:hypothetical protein ACI7RC_04275 [Brevibacillus sp. B_LB10_24]|uniref:hypothetical protein n=1 Tax=Brevibacillus sp. B_LB10_24 TaxID=3380645 RepID=UPI0038BD1804
MKDEQLDKLLRQALSSTIQPSDELNQKVMNHFKERAEMKKPFKKRLSVALIAAAITVTTSITALAASHLLNTRQIAEQLGDQALARAFDQEHAITANESIVSGGFTFTFLGIVSGKGLSDFGGSASEIHPDRTYAVVSIEKQDGSKMPDTQDEEYGKTPFFVSPLIKGQKPWLVNIASMNGGYSEFVKDGVTYRLIELDGIEKFADRGVYLAVSTSAFYDINAFHYDEKTGEISRNTEYSGGNALFNLPLDVKKADHDQAEKYLQQLLQEPAEGSTVGDAAAKDWKNAVVIPESMKKVTPDKDGMLRYEYAGTSVSLSVDVLFKEGETGLTDMAAISEGNGERIGIRFSRDAAGVITGMAVRLN